MRLFLLILVLINFGCEKKVVKYVDLSTQPFSPCDRGVDFNSRQCNRTIEDHTFWLGELRLENKRTGEFQPIKVIYEFSPDGSGATVGNFKRAIFAEDPKNHKTIGYLEVGQLSRISHNAIDLNIKWDSCNGDRLQFNSAAAEKGFEPLSMDKTKFYQRKGDDFFEIQNSKPQNLLEALVTLPFKILVGIVQSLINAFSFDSAQSLFDQNVSLKPYRFELREMPVQWGCTIDRKFKTPINLIQLD